MSLRERGLEQRASEGHMRPMQRRREQGTFVCTHSAVPRHTPHPPSRSFSLLCDSHLNVPQEPPCSDELERTGAARGGGWWGEAAARRGWEPAVDSEFSSALGSQLRSLQTPHLSVLQAETS